MYRLRVEEFSDTHTVVTVDNPGHGHSDIPSVEFAISDCAQEAYEIVRELHIARTVFIGTSLGGLVGAKLAAM